MRVKWIDSAKGIAILLVIIGHASLGRTDLFNFVYGIHLVVFFLLSGYTLKRKDITMSYVNDKFNRLMIPYFYTCIAIIITDIINSIILNSNGGEIGVISNVIANDLVRSFFASGDIHSFGNVELGYRIGAIWFLPALFFSHLLFQMLLSYNLDDYMLGCVTILLGTLGYILARFIWLPFSIQSSMMALPFLWVGFETKKYNLLDQCRWQHYMIAQLILLVGIFLNYCNVSFVNAYMNDLFFSFVTGLAGSLLVYLLSVLMKKDCFFSYIGKISLTVLCVHLYALETMGVYFERFLNRVGLNGNAYIIAFIFIEIVFAVVIAGLIETLRKQLFSRERGKGYCSKDEQGLARVSDQKRIVNIIIGIVSVVILVDIFPVSENLQKMIKPFYIIPIIALGYCNGKNRVFQSKELVKEAIPYIIFLIVQNLLHRNLILQMTKNGEIVAPVNMLPILVLVYLIYFGINKFVNGKRWIMFLTILLSSAMYFLNIDIHNPLCIVKITGYCLIYYYTGILLAKSNGLKVLLDAHIFYFLLSAIFAYFVYNGSISLLSLFFGRDYGLTFLGNVSIFVLIYKSSLYLEKAFPRIVLLFEEIGKAFAWILVVYALFENAISQMVALRFDEMHVPFMGIKILVILGLSVVLQNMIGIVLASFKVTKENEML